VSVETCDDQIAQENDHLKREVKKLELEVNKLKKKLKYNLLKITIAMW
jgi:cell division protein FtsB